MKVLVACEFSGIVRDAFASHGHYAVSCDIIPSEKRKGNHYIGDARDLLDGAWDLMIAHPPCTHLAVSGARWWKDKKEEQEEAIKFFFELWNCKIPRICIENPVGIIGSKYLKCTQTIQPYEFGHNEQKRTCLWLKNLPELYPTKRMTGRIQKIHNIGESSSRARERSRFYTGIAIAMAKQWGQLE